MHRWDVGDSEEVIGRLNELEAAMSGIVKAISVRVNDAAA